MAGEKTYLGGGELNVSLYNADGTVATDVISIGYVQEFSITKTQDSVKAYTYENGYEETVTELVTKNESTIKFATTNLNDKNLALFFGATLDSVSGDMTFDGTLKQITVKLTFNSVNRAGGEREYVFEKVNLKASGDLALIAKDFAKISFEGTAVKGSNGNVLTIKKEVV